MEVVIKSCAGLDVHKETVVACVRLVDTEGRVREEVRTFKTFTRNLLGMSDWFREEGVTHVAMESTGIYWKPIFNVLEEQFEILLANPHRMKHVPGRKTDVKDCQWIAKLLQHGLLAGSFIPPRPQRELRDLTRERAKLVDEKTRIANRIQKVLEDGNVKLGSVASDVLGVSGRAILQALSKGESRADILADMAVGRLREKLPALRSALTGAMTEHHRFMLGFELDRLRSIESHIATLDARIEDVCRPFEWALHLLITIPGVKQCTAQNLLAEIGPSMDPFASAGHLASWTGICPGNKESAGKRLSGKTAKGNRWCRRALTEAGWAAGRTKKSYYSALFRRIAAKRGTKRAVVAVAHAIVVALYHMLQQRRSHLELGPEHFDRLNGERLKRYYVRRLRDLGVNVQIAQEPAAA
jgi:transposase